MGMGLVTDVNPKDMMDGISGLGKDVDISVGVNRIERGGELDGISDFGDLKSPDLISKGTNDSETVKLVN